MKIEAIDLFCGIGGLTHGLQEAKINVLAGIDCDATCKEGYETSNNVTFLTEDIATYDFTEVANKYSNDAIKVLVGCAPCQSFSQHTKKQSQQTREKKQTLINHFIRAIDTIQPDIISMENVRGILKTDVYKKFIHELEKSKYQIDAKIVYCPAYGVPQSRYRLVLLASKLGELKLIPEILSKNNYKTVEDTIKSLDKLRQGKTNATDPMHRASKLSHINLKRIKCSKPGSTWNDWDIELRPKCFRKPSGKSYSSVYGRMSWKKPAPTLTTQFNRYGTGRFGHPKQHRALSLREGALLQTFPDDYNFGNISLTTTARHIGNAVPPLLGQAIGKSIYQHVKQYQDNTDSLNKK